MTIITAVQPHTMDSAGVVQKAAHCSELPAGFLANRERGDLSGD